MCIKHRPKTCTCMRKSLSKLSNAIAGISLFTSRDILYFVLGDKGNGAHCHAQDSLDSIHLIQVHLCIVLMEC